MLNPRRLLILLPVYLAVAMGLDYLFDSSTRASTKALPAWVVVGFVVSTLLVAAAVTWYLMRRGCGIVSDQRHRTYMALLAAIVVSGLFTDVLKGVLSAALGGHPWWAMLPIYILGYLTCWAVLLIVLNRTKTSSRP